METQGLWDVVVNQFVIILLVEFVLIRQSLSIETNAAKIVQHTLFATFNHHHFVSCICSFLGFPGQILD